MLDFTPHQTLYIIAPATNLGQALASFIMILGYGIIAIPTDILTNEMAKGRAKGDAVKLHVCSFCGATNHPINAKYCYGCTKVLP